MHIVRRAQQFDDENADAPIHAAHQRFQQKAIALESGCGAALRGVQLRARASQLADHSGDAIWHRGSRLEHQRFNNRTGVKNTKVQENATTALFSLLSAHLPI